jgi:hypothetical protein
MVRAADFQNTGPVSGAGVAGASTTMHRVQKDLKSVTDDLVGFNALDLANHADTADVMLHAGIAKSSGCGRAV